MWSFLRKGHAPFMQHSVDKSSCCLDALAAEESGPNLQLSDINHANPY